MWVNINSDDNIALSGNNTSVTRISDSNSVTGVSDAFLPSFLTANHDIPMSNNFYFEVMVLQGNNHIAVGLGRCVITYDTSTQTNSSWPSTNSFVYHSDSGNIWLHEIGKDYGLPLNINDVLGCGIDRGKQSIFFTINGTFWGEAFHLDSIPSLIPVVGIRGIGTTIKTNFGQDPFIYQPNQVPVLNFPTPTSFYDEWVNHANFSSQSTDGKYYRCIFIKIFVINFVNRII